MERVIIPNNRSKTIPPKQGSFFRKKDSSLIFIQPKLTINQPNDPYEQEADAMADRVTDNESIQQPFFKPVITTIQRKCEEEDKIQRKPLSAFITPFIQTKRNGEATTSGALTNRINNSRGSGTSIDGETRSFMESRFGSDFSIVKIHTGNESVMMNRDLNAKAFTVGNDIYFNEGKYEPNTSDGKKLLAHELTHVVQQCGIDSIQRDPQPTQVVAATATDHREFVDDSIYFLEISAANLGDMNIDQAAVDRILHGWNINANTVETNITQQLNNDQALRTRFRQAYSNALKVLVNRASVRLNKPAARIYMENWQRIPEWASFRLSDIPATTEAQRRAIIQSTIGAFNDIALFNGFNTLDRPTLESLLRRLRDFAIENREMIRNQIANDLAFAQQLKEAYRQAVRTLLNRAAPTIGSTVFDLYMEFRYGASDLILDWADETVPRISTPIPQGLTPTRSGSVVYTYHGINVTILPDGTKSSPGAITDANFDFNNAMHATPDRSGVIIRHRGPGQPRLTIGTRYGPRLAATTRSGYGRGTTATDIAEGDTSLGFHEGHHGRDFLEFIENHPWQQFTGTDGMSVREFRQAMTDYSTAAFTYSADLERFSELQTDCVGVTIEDHYRGLSRRSPVNC